MGRMFKGEVTSAVRMLQRNKGRSVLTMLGIIIGVASVITVVGIGQGVAQQVTDQTQHLGKDLILVRAGQLQHQQGIGDVLGSFTESSSVEAGGILNSSDVQVVQRTQGVATAIPLSFVSGGVASGESNAHYDLPVLGTGAGLPEMLNQPLSYGTFFDSNNNAVNQAVIGSHVAQTMFDQNVPLGQVITIHGNQFIVSGIFSDFNSAPLPIDVDFNNAVFISNDQAQAITNSHAQVYELLVRPEHPNQTDSVVRAVNSSLLAAHGGQQDFTVLKESQARLIASSILGLLTGLIAGFAGVALLVGGVGIMNVMLVSVTERMHEIGIRKAVGATNRQILMQFIIEAGVLSIVGAITGVILSFAIAILLRLFTNLTPTITWQVVTIACFASVFIGVLFGSAPAMKAARKQPIAALRNE